MTQKPHYEVEDVPPQDTDTKVQLFEQAAETVKDAVLVAQQIRDDAEKVLGGIYDSAEKAGDTALANRVNDAWEHVQSLATVAARQGAALRGASGAMTTIKEQRDKVLEELNGLKEAIDNLEIDHPELEDFVETLEEGWQESQWYYYDEYYDDAYTNIREEIFFILRNRIGMTNGEADHMFGLLKGEELMTDEQMDILKQFAVTLRAEKAESDE